MKKVIFVEPSPATLLQLCGRKRVLRLHLPLPSL